MMEKLNFVQNNETFFNPNHNGGINQIKGNLDEDDNRQFRFESSNS